MKTNYTKLTDDQLRIACSFYSGVRTCNIDKSLKKMINYVYECAIENEKLYPSPKKTNEITFKICTHHPASNEEIAKAINNLF